MMGLVSSQKRTLELSPSLVPSSLTLPKYDKLEKKIFTMPIINRIHIIQNILSYIHIYMYTHTHTHTRIYKEF